MNDTTCPPGLIDLAAEHLGGRAIACSDDFFASMTNLVKPGRGVFVPDKFTDRGKWMDGWESRRKRGPGHDWCVVALGLPGVVRAFDIDTNHFLGNHPAFASIDGAYIPKPSAQALEDADWQPLVPQMPLRPGAPNLGLPTRMHPVTHIRLNIFPDGGVARLRAYGDVNPQWDDALPDEETQRHVESGWVDLAALRHGARTLCCSDAFFSPMENLISPGRADTMGGGWETKRRRGPGEDWMIVRLAAHGCPKTIEIDTNHFKGNFPDRARLEALDVPLDTAPTDLIASREWVALLDEQHLGAHTRHFFSQLHPLPSVSHIRLTIVPDGGVSRLRVWGPRDA